MAGRLGAGLEELITKINLVNLWNNNYMLPFYFFLLYLSTLNIIMIIRSCAAVPHFINCLWWS